MCGKRAFRVGPKPGRESFSLVELLVIMVIILIITGFSIAAANGVANKAARSRTTAEIQAIGTALESYKTDNDIYPPSTGLVPGNYTASDGTGGTYTAASTILYSSLAGTTNFLAAAPTGTKVYMTFSSSEVANQAGASYVEDPWGNAYGYATGPKPSAATPATTPYNGVESYDLWSTGGALAGTATFTNSWIANWK